MKRDAEEVIAGALLGTFVGDALGARFEGSAPADGRNGHERVARSVAEGELSYTDDTQLALALAEHLVDHPQVDPEALVATFLDHYEPWRGYGPGMHALVDRWRAGMPIDEAATDHFEDGSFGNGAAMRVAAVGVRWSHDHDVLAEVAARQARTTHVHPLGVAGAVVQARAVGLAAEAANFGPAELATVASLTSEPDLRAPLDAALEMLDVWDRSAETTLADIARRLGNAPVAHRSVPAALWAAAAAADPHDAYALAVGIGGDADTIAAMTGAVVGAAVTRRGLPQEWIELLEDGPRGRTFAMDLARNLATSLA